MTIARRLIKGQSFINPDTDRAEVVVRPPIRPLHSDTDVVTLITDRGHLVLWADEEVTITGAMT